MIREQDSVSQRLQRFQRDIDYYEAHRAELLDRYPEQWVVIFNEQVVDAAPTIEQALSGLRAKGVPPGQGLVEHLTRHDELLILAS